MLISILSRIVNKYLVCVSTWYIFDFRLVQNFDQTYIGQTSNRNNVSNKEHQNTVKTAEPTLSLVQLMEATFHSVDIDRTKAIASTSHSLHGTYDKKNNWRRHRDRKATQQTAQEMKTNHVKMSPKKPKTLRTGTSPITEQITRKKHPKVNRRTNKSAYIPGEEMKHLGLLHTITRFTRVKDRRQNKLST